MIIRNRRLWNRSVFHRLTFLTWLVLAFGAPATAAIVSSPDGRLVLTIETIATERNPVAQRLVYRVSFRGKQF